MLIFKRQPAWGHFYLPISPSPRVPKRRYDTRVLKAEFDMMGQLYYDPHPPVQFVFPRTHNTPQPSIHLQYDPTWVKEAEWMAMGPIGGQHNPGDAAYSIPTMMHPSAIRAPNMHQV